MNIFVILKWRLAFKYFYKEKKT